MKLRFKIFEIRREMNISTTSYSHLGMVTTSCFDEAFNCKSLKEASDWRDEHQKFYGQYLIIPCY